MFTCRNYVRVHTVAVQSRPTLLSIPTEDEQKELTKVNFKDQEQVTDLAARCNKLTDDARTLENCLFDAVIFDGDMEQATANANAAAAASAGSNKSSSNDNTNLGVGLGVGLGLIALAAIIIAGVTYVKFRRLRSAHSTALIELNHARGSQGQSSGDMSIPLTENV